MAKFVFGSGALYGVSQSAGVQTPVRFGTLQEVSFETSANIKELFGGDQFAEDVRRGTIKVSCTAKFASINGGLLNSLYFGQSMTDGMTKMADRESATIPASAAYDVTVTNAATYIADYGVLDGDTGIPFIKVASSPAVGQYSVNTATGVYTFNASDASKPVAISYTYKATGGKTIAVYSQPLGTTPTFEAFLKDDKSDFGIRLFKCTASKLSLATKLEDFAVPDFAFSAFKRADRKVMELYTAE